MEMEEDAIPSLETSEGVAHTSSDQPEHYYDEPSIEDETEVQRKRDADVSLSLAATVQPSILPLLKSHHSSAQARQDFYLSSTMVPLN